MSKLDLVNMTYSIGIPSNRALTVLVMFELSMKSQGASSEKGIYLDGAKYNQ